MVCARDVRVFVSQLGPVLHTEHTQTITQARRNIYSIKNRHDPQELRFCFVDFFEQCKRRALGMSGSLLVN